MKKKLHKILISLGALAFIGTSTAAVVSCGTAVSSEGDQNDVNFNDQVNLLAKDLKNQNIVFKQYSVIQDEASLIGSNKYGVGTLIEGELSKYTLVDHYSITDRTTAIDTQKVSSSKKAISLEITFYDEDGKLQSAQTISFYYTVEKGEISPTDTFSTDLNNLVTSIQSLSINVDSGSVWDESKIRSLIEPLVSKYTSILSFKVTETGTLDTNNTTDKDVRRNVSITLQFTSSIDSTSYARTMPISVNVRKSVPDTNTFAEDVNSSVNSIKALAVTVPYKSAWIATNALSSKINTIIADYPSIKSASIKSSTDVDTNTAGDKDVTLVVTFTDAKNSQTSDQTIQIKVTVTSAPATFESDVQTAINAIQSQRFLIDLSIPKANTFGAVRNEITNQFSTFNYGTVVNLDSENPPYVQDIYNDAGVVAQDTDAVQNFGQTSLQGLVVFTNISSKQTIKQKISIDLDIQKYIPATPKQTTVFSPYLDASLTTAGNDLTNAVNFTKEEGTPELKNATLSFMNYDKDKDAFTFGGKSIGTVVNEVYNQHPDMQYTIATGGANAGTINSFVPGQDGKNGYLNSNIASSMILDTLKIFNAHTFDWDLEGTTTTSANALAGITDVAKQLKMKAAAHNYDLKQMVTVSGGGQTDWPIQAKDITADLVDKASYNEYLQNNQNPKGVIDAFYDAGIDPIVNVMTMNFGTWRMNYDSSAIMGMGAIKNYLQTIVSKRAQPWTTEELYQHVGITPMIGVNDTTATGGVGPYNANENNGPTGVGSGYFTWDGAVKASYWARKLNIGYLSFWSISRDHPGYWNPALYNNYGMDGTDFVFTKTFIDGLFK